MPTGRYDSLYDLLACPTCRVAVLQQSDRLSCPQCGLEFPILNGVPVMFPDGRVPDFQHEQALQQASTYVDWHQRVILQSLLDDQVVVEIGSGNMALDDPCIIRMDVVLSPHVDVLGDAHHMPFLPDSLDYVFSQAVFEHLRNPYEAAQSIYDCLKDGGYVYHECNFVFAYHGYPHHYCNASLQGMEQIFSPFTPLKTGIAPYQMPSFALEMVLLTYLRHSRLYEFRHGQELAQQLEALLHMNLREYDIYFEEKEALYVAAGTYFAGIKQATPGASLLPAALGAIWQADGALQQRFPNPNDLTTTHNLLIWARQEAPAQYPALEAALQAIQPFNKRGPAAPWDRTAIRSLPYVEPRYHAVGSDPDRPLAQQARALARRRHLRSPQAALRWVFWRGQQGVRLSQKAWRVLQTEGLQACYQKIRRYLAPQP